MGYRLGETKDEAENEWNTRCDPNGEILQFQSDTELIYRDNCVFELYKYCIENKIDARTFMICKKAIKNAKAIDATPVIRCKSCKYSSEFQPFTCLCTTTKIRMPLDGYCSDGLLKEE